MKAGKGHPRCQATGEVTPGSKGKEGSSLLQVRVADLSEVKDGRTSLGRHQTLRMHTQV